MLSGEVDKLRERNDALYKRLDVGTDYENQLQYLTRMEERTESDGGKSIIDGSRT